MSGILIFLICTCAGFFSINVYELIKSFKNAYTKNLEKKLERRYYEGYIDCNALHMSYDMVKIADGNYILVSWTLFEKFRKNELWLETFRRATYILTKQGYHVVISPLIRTE